MKTEQRIYRVTWNGHPQPIGNVNSFDSVKAYINHSLRYGTDLWRFEIFDQFGQLKTNIINEPAADPTLIKNYFKVY
jgi:hypothetical protein